MALRPSTRWLLPVLVHGRAATTCSAGRRASDDAKGEHGVRNLREARDVRARHVAARLAILVGGLEAPVVYRAHDRLQPLLGVLKAPRVARGVLLHLQGARGDA